VQVLDLMTTEVFTVGPDTAIKEAAQLIFRHRVSGLPVVDDSGRLVGIITEADFLRLEVARVEEADPAPLETVGEVMSRGVVTISPEQGVAEAAKIMVV